MKITTSGSRRQAQLVESCRDDAGKVKKRTVATPGRPDQIDRPLNAVIQGLMKVSGQVPTPTPMISSPSIAFETARAFGDVWALTGLWKELGFSALRQVFRKTRHTADVEALVRVMVLNRLRDPESKLGVHSTAFSITGFVSMAPHPYPGCLPSRNVKARFCMPSR